MWVLIFIPSSGTRTITGAHESDAISKCARGLIIASFGSQAAAQPKVVNSAWWITKESQLVPIRADIENAKQPHGYFWQPWLLIAKDTQESTWDQLGNVSTGDQWWLILPILGLCWQFLNGLFYPLTEFNCKAVTTIWVFWLILCIFFKIAVYFYCVVFMKLYLWMLMLLCLVHNIYYDR